MTLPCTGSAKFPRAYASRGVVPIYIIGILPSEFIIYSHLSFRTLTPGHDPVQKVTLIPRGQARGLTWFIPMDDPTLISKQQLFARIVGGLGGRAAEEIIFGEPEVTTGAAGDLQQITGLAKQVCIFHFIN